MPKIIELTVEIEIQRVSCPGVWLCQDGRVSLTVFALGTSYQTCLLPPMFPLLFKDVFYFRKRFQETCALNNICCLLKDETIFCELVQWCEDCNTGECTILAQYLGALNDVLFPPNMCSTDGVDLLMRRSKDFPGILSPKIEIATKVRIDEVWNTGCHISQLKTNPCICSPDADLTRQRQVCHTPQYHRSKCGAGSRRPRSRSWSGGSRSCVSLRDHDPCKCTNPMTSAQNPARPRSASRARPSPTYNVYTGTTVNAAWCDIDRNTRSREQELLDMFEDHDAYENSPSDSKASSRPSSPKFPCTDRHYLDPQLSIDDLEPSAERHERSTQQRRSPIVPNSSVTLRERSALHSSPNREASIPKRKCSANQRENTANPKYSAPKRFSRVRSSIRGRCQYGVYNVNTRDLPVWTRGLSKDVEDYDDGIRLPIEKTLSPTEARREERYQKIQLESRYIEDESERSKTRETFKNIAKPRLRPCICEICKRYHELFHSDSEYTKC